MISSRCGGIRPSSFTLTKHHSSPHLAANALASSSCCKGHTCSVFTGAAFDGAGAGAGAGFALGRGGTTGVGCSDLGGGAGDLGAAEAANLSVIFWNSALLLHCSMCFSRSLARPVQKHRIFSSAALGHSTSLSGHS